MDNGEGLKNIYPALKGNALILDDSFSLPCLIRNGHEGRGIGAPMPKFPELSEVEISNIVNFLRYDLNSGSFLSYDELKRQLKTCEQQK